LCFHKKKYYPHCTMSIKPPFSRCDGCNYLMFGSPSVCAVCREEFAQYVEGKITPAPDIIKMMRIMQTMGIPYECLPYICNKQTHFEPVDYTAYELSTRPRYFHFSVIRNNIKESTRTLFFYNKVTLSQVISAVVQSSPYTDHIITCASAGKFDYSDESCLALYKYRNVSFDTCPNGSSFLIFVVQ